LTTQGTEILTRVNLTVFDNNDSLRYTLTMIAPTGRAHDRYEAHEDRLEEEEEAEEEDHD